MRLGPLRHQIVIEQEVRTPDGLGGYTVAWSTFDTLWASVQPLSGNEAVVARQLQDSITHKVRMRYRAGVKAAMRISWNGRTFNIREVRNVDERNRMIELRVEEGVAT